MPLFQNSVLVKYQKTLNKQTIQDAYLTYKSYFHNTTIQENIRNSKEEQFQEGFLNELFCKILGYTLNPNPDYNLITENKNIKDSKKADGAILVNNAVKVVIELKGTDTTDLGKIEIQAFGYKNNQPECIYVITSNFEKLRFYIDNAIEYLEFNLFTLSQAEFELLYTCLAYDNIKDGLPKKLKDDSIGEENKVTKQLYTDYSLFKKELYQSLVDLNSQYEPLELFKKSQKLLDRFLFLFFAEDRNLLPPNSVRLILNDWKDLQDRDEEIPLYNRFKKYFEYLNTGFKGKRYDVFAYNGGLFKPDEILDNVIINDDLLFKHAFKLSEYDFVSEIDVNILGHIFENSLNELDEVKAQLEGQEIDKTKTKRKKDGVFYTPKYITKYIVDNTIGKLCTEKKAELNIVETEYAQSLTREHAPLPITKKKKQELLTKLTEYKNWLLQLTICDPACGSGAFLNQALDFLITEHKYIDELQAKLFGDTMVLSDMEKSILENNLFGVDLNDESVEIAKLSLWLRTAQPNRKLNDLNNNIKCGNSLIDDPAIAGEKAFNWQNAFPQVFEKKEKIPYHITTAIHDSRTSDRMITYNVREKRANGSIPEPQVIWLTEEEEELITKTVVEIIEQDNLNVLAYNICRDHMHLLLVCEEQERDSIVQKIKAKTARAVNILRGVTVPSSSTTREHAPLSLAKEAPLSIEKVEKTRGEKQNSLWTQKYGCNKIEDDQQLNNTVEYIRNNRIKHNLPPLLVLQQGSILPCLYQSSEHAFRTEYKGGFDVVIGNPPYGAELQSKDWLKIKYQETSFGNIDSYKYFVQLGSNILKKLGCLGFIMPDSYLEKEYFKDVRVFVCDSFQNITNIKLGDDVFEEVNLPTSILITEFKGVKAEKFNFLDLSNITGYSKTNELFNNTNFITDIPIYSESFVIIKSIINKKNTIDLIDIYEQIMGVKVYQIGKGKPKQTSYELENNSFVNQNQNEKYNYKFISQGIKRYCYENTNEFISYGAWLAEPRELKYFEGPKIIIREIVNPRVFATHIDYPAIVKNIAAVIIEKDKNYSLKYLLSIVNAKLFTYFITEQSAKSSNKSYPSFSSKLIKELPIKVATKTEQQPFIEKADQMLSLNKELQELSQKFQRTIIRKFFPSAVATTKEHALLPQKLQDWYLITYAEFIKELDKKKVKLSLAQEAEWEEYFTQEAKKALALKQQIDTTDKEIDQMVYKLYELTEEEIKIVEGE